VKSEKHEICRILKTYHFSLFSFHFQAAFFSSLPSRWAGVHGMRALLDELRASI
jgi:hypothetical protein